MVRILYFTDTHAQATTPENRKDDFPATLREKMREIVEIAQSRKVDLVLHGADLFNSPIVSLAIAAEFATFLREMGAPVYGPSGTHDVFGHNPETVGRTVMGLLHGLGFARLLTPEPTYLDIKGMRLQLTGQPYHYEIDRRDPSLDYWVKKRDCDVAIHIVHGMLVDKKMPEGAIYTMVDRVIGTEADVTFTGHLHSGFKDVHTEDGKWIVNPGAVVRISNDLSEIKRKPEVVICDIESPTDIKMTHVHLKSAKPGEEVLDRARMESEKKRKEELQKFVAGLSFSDDSYSVVDVHDILNEVAALENVDPKVKAAALARLAKAQERLSRGEEV